MSVSVPAAQAPSSPVLSPMSSGNRSRRSHASIADSRVPHQNFSAAVMPGCSPSRQHGCMARSPAMSASVSTSGPTQQRSYVYSPPQHVPSRPRQQRANDMLPSKQLAAPATPSKTSSASASMGAHKLEQRLSQNGYGSR